MYNDSSILIPAVAATVGTTFTVYAVYKWIKAEYALSQYINKYETEKEMQKQLVHNYSSIDNFPNLSDIIPPNAIGFHEKLAKYCIEMCIKYSVSQNRILDVGCGVGALSFSLSAYFKEVIGTDISYAMITAGQQMKQFAQTSTPFSVEGGKYIKMCKLEVPKDTNRERVTFWDEDACSLIYKCGKFDVVVIANTLTDLSSPLDFLTDIYDYVNPNGLLIIADSYNWLNGPEENLGGDGTKLTSCLIKEILSKEWIFCNKTELQFCIPQCSRVAMVGTNEVSVWKRKELEI